MAILIAVVKKNGELGYSASYSDFPKCAVAARIVNEVVAKAKYTRIAHIESLLADRLTLADFDNPLEATRLFD